MAANSNIEWTDHTFNPWRGCSKVHAGCTNCYAEAGSKRNPDVLGIWGTGAQGATRVVAAESMWREPMKWNREAAANGQQVRVFAGSFCDVFEDWRGPMHDSQGNLLVRNFGSEKWFAGQWSPAVTGATEESLTMQYVRNRLFSVSDQTPNLLWLVLTKRPQNIMRMLPAVEVNSQEKADDRNERGELYRRNVMLGTSVSDQATADELIPELLNCRDLCRGMFVSAEPLLGPIDLFNERRDLIGPVGRPGVKPICPGISWVIAGGESGPNARPCNVEWIRDMFQQCRAANVLCFVKQLGSNPQGNYHPPRRGPQAGGGLLTSIQAGVKHPKGGDPDEWPVDLRVQEVPK